MTELKTLDVRVIPPVIRHQRIFEIFDALQSGEAFILVNDHAPRPLYYEFLHERPDQFTWEYLEEGPEIWKAKIGRV
ncbi:MAG: DUF2249 domain-containing protein [Anaerolineae bacterium]|nr:DUF2249 domain-containing protein [Anaerolineae bacterium]